MLYRLICMGRIVQNEYNIISVLLVQFHECANALISCLLHAYGCLALWLYFQYAFRHELCRYIYNTSNIIMHWKNFYSVYDKYNFNYWSIYKENKVRSIRCGKYLIETPPSLFHINCWPNIMINGSNWRCIKSIASSHPDIILRLSLIIMIECP